MHHTLYHVACLPLAIEPAYHRPLTNAFFVYLKRRKPDVHPRFPICILHCCASASLHAHGHANLAEVCPVGHIADACMHPLLQHCWPAVTDTRTELICLRYGCQCPHAFGYVTIDTYQIMTIVRRIPRLPCDNQSTSSRSWVQPLSFVTHACCS